MSSASALAPDSFHGVPLPGADEKTPSPSQGPAMREAEVVASKDDRMRTRELIREAARAEMSAHSSSDGSDEGPYERRLQRLEELQRRHHGAVDLLQRAIPYAQSCVDMGELHYELGHMEESQECFTDALKRLMEPGDDDGEEIEARPMIARCMHWLGAIHARCGEYDEASRWYDESLKLKRQIVDEGAGGSTEEAGTRHFELGTTYNGMAALEVMSGGDVRWDEAMSLFRKAEESYLHGYECAQPREDRRTALDAESHMNVTKEAMGKMPPRRVEALINVRSNMGELYRQRGQHEPAVRLFRLALEMARTALENVHEKRASIEAEGEDCPNVSAGLDGDDGPSVDEQRNNVVDLLLKVADCLFSAKKYDEAAGAYEEALGYHVFFRGRVNGDDCTDGTSLQLSEQTTALPAISTKVELDLSSATTTEAAIRNNLAHALNNIGQNDLALGHFEASLSIKRKIGGDSHVEVGHTLMGMGALVGGPYRDFPKALNCFKEALHIYRANLEEHRRRMSEGGSSGGTYYFDDEDAEELDRLVQNATKNVGMIEAAMLRDRDGVSRRRRR